MEIPGGSDNKNVEKSRLPEKANRRILVGDNDLMIARDTFDLLPEEIEVEYVSDPIEFIKKAIVGNYWILITDLRYTPDGDQGFHVLRSLSHLETRKILFTSHAKDPDVKAQGEALGAEVYHLGILDVIAEIRKMVEQERTNVVDEEPEKIQEITLERIKATS